MKPLPASRRPKDIIMNRHPRSFDTISLLQTAPVVLLAIWVLTVLIRSL